MIYPKVETSGTDDSSPGASCAQGVNASPSFPRLEGGVLRYWRMDGTFKASIGGRESGPDGANEFVFYDGPPFANGLPHYGHLLTGYIKDLIPRYKTMCGHRVERRFGWDCNGLPAELEAQRVLGLKTKAEIVKFGIEKFSEVCRASVLKYTREWQDYVKRQARWVDFDNDYKTLDLDYMESVVWAFQQLYDKGLVYEGARVLPYCWNDETPLSAHELRMDDDSYRDRQDPSVTVSVRLETGERLLAWTTTPWTLPSNLAMAVLPDLDYVAVEHDGTRYILAEGRLGAYVRELGADAASRIVARYRGSDLIGRRYEPIFGFLADTERWGTAAAFRIIESDDVTTDDGTGVVQMAPAYGEADHLACEAAGIPAILTVDDRARFTEVVPPYCGLHVFEANRPIINDLKKTGALLSERSYTHSYPHCWRCREPLIYKAVSSWFVSVTKIKDRMLELNEEITWVPRHVKHGQFGKWLANARDWSISRNRFWGSPIPVWKSDNPEYPRVDVYGSIESLKADFGVEVTDLHRPYIDRLTRTNPDDPSGRSTMRRVPEVLDVWFDSGAMPFAQIHYPFENEEWFKDHYPGDFIVEYIGQTRGWFYTLHILATALFDRPAFKSCLSHGIVLGNDGRKMSKSLQNYPDVFDVYNRDGADAMRWFLMASQVVYGGNLIVTEQGIRDEVRQVLMPLWNAWYFFSVYANAACGGQGYDAAWSTGSANVLDAYVLAKLRLLVERAQGNLDTYEISAACDAVRGFLDVLTNWYIRRSRERFWDGESERFTAAADTLYTCLEVLTRVCAPLLPLVTEEIWRGLTGGRSVHLTNWPSAAELPADDELVASMDQVRDICSTALALRKKDGIRVRQPLRELTIVTDRTHELDRFRAIVADEVNVQKVLMLSMAEAGTAGVSLSQVLTVDPRVAGPRLGKDVQTAIRAAKSGDWSLAGDGTVTAGGIVLMAGEYTVRSALKDQAEAKGGRAVAADMLREGGFIALDVTVTPELAREGLARDVVRAVQQARRAARLNVSDRILLTIAGDADIRAAADAHREMIISETLACVVEIIGADELPSNAGVETAVGDGHTVRVVVKTNAGVSGC